MDVVVRDAAVLAALRTAWVAAYLESRGWTCEQDSDLFLRYARESTRVFVPKQPAFDDYPLHMARLVEVAASVEGRSQLEILHAVEAIGHDLLALRDTTDSADGTTSLAAGRRMLAVAETSLRIAAARVVRKKPPAEREGKTKAFLRTVRLGQTERGSYVQRVLTPVPEPDDQQQSISDLGAPAPLEREATYTAATILHVVGDAAREAFDHAPRAQEVFNQAGIEGVTQALCKNLADAAESARGEAIEISFAFTPLLPGTPRVEPVRVERELVEPLRAGATMLRTMKRPTVLGVEGWVIQLRRDGEEPGRVTIIAQIRGGRPQAVAMTLDAEDYEKAIEAHKDARIVRAMGSLHERQGRYQLDNVTSFRLISDPAEMDLKG